MTTSEHRERTKKYLKQIIVYDVRISRCKKWIQELETYKNRLDPERYQRYVDEQNEWIESYSAKRDELISQIVTLPDQYANLLLMIYVKGIRTSDIPEILNYHISHVTRLHSAAIDFFYKQYAAAIDYWTPVEEDDEQSGV